MPKREQRFVLVTPPLPLLLISALLLLYICALLPLLAGCRQEPEPPEEKTTLSLLSGGSGSRYASLGQEVAERINARSETISVVPRLSAGPEANLRLLAEGKGQLALISADLVYFAGKGTEMFAHAPAKGDISFLALLELEPLFILGRQDGSLVDAASLEGKTISVGQGGSRTQILACRLLEAFEFGPDSARLYYLREREALRSLEEDELDAAFYLSPFAGGDGSQEIAVISFTSRQEEAWKEALPFAEAARIPAGAFGGQEEDISVPGIPLFLAAAKDLEPEILNDLLKALKETPYQVVALKPPPYPPYGYR